MTADSTERLLRSILPRLDDTDRQLEVLADLLGDNDTFQVPLPLGMLVDGFRLRGSLSGTKDWAISLDRSLVEVVERAKLVINGEPAKDFESSQVIRQTFMNAFSTAFQNVANENLDARRKAKNRLDEFFSQTEGSIKLGDVPAELIDDYLDYFTPRAALSLSNVEIWHYGEGWSFVGVMRVKLRSISAWWVEVPGEATGGR